MLAPVSARAAPARQQIGSFVLSIQDDEGYLRLTKRLAGLDVLMYMNLEPQPKLVKNSLGPEPGSSARRAAATATAAARFRAFTLHAEAFPSGR